MKKMLFGALALLFSATAFAKSPVIEFAENSYDFGTVKEEVGKVSHIFEFKNTGDTALVLSNVRASCGCTTPQWSRDPIPAGQKGSITVTYNASNRPGPFTKAITITSNAPQKVITINGTVTPHGRKVEDSYPVLKGDVRLQYETLSLGEVSNKSQKNGKLGIANVSSKNITVKFAKVPGFITIKDLTLKAGEVANIDATFDAVKAKDWGSVSYPIEFTTSENPAKQTFKINAAIFEEYTNEQRANAPHLDVDREINLGNIELGSKKKVTIKVTNNGKSDLFIRKVSTENEAAKVKVSKDAIGVGKSADIKMTLKGSKLEKGSGMAQVIIIANDPSQNMKRVNVKYSVVDKIVK